MVRQAEVGVASVEFMQLAARSGNGTIASVYASQREAASGELNLFLSMVSFPALCFRSIDDAARDLHVLQDAE
jgi:hypothetical protein